MGKVFQHIADGAMYPCRGDQCHHCERTDAPIYDFAGRIVDPSLAKSPALAAQEPEVGELCATCILGGNVLKSDYSVREMMPLISKWAADPERAVAEYHRTPDIPLFLQRVDWPICCGEWCEFIGIPASYDESRCVPQLNWYWERGPRECGHGELHPESLREVSLFRCHGCNAGWFTWQYT